MKEFTQEINLVNYSDYGNALSDPYLTFSVSENMLEKLWYVQCEDAFLASLYVSAKLSSYNLCMKSVYWDKFCEYRDEESLQWEDRIYYQGLSSIISVFISL